jgi:hypothetical protein
MKAVYLSETFRNALTANGLPIRSIKSLEDLHKYFTYDDCYVIKCETEALLNTNALVGYKFESLLVDEDAPYSAPPAKVIDSMRKELSDATFKCVAVDPNIVVLYAYSMTPPQRGCIENVFNALALIMPVNAVMQTGQYQHYILQ